MITPSIIKQIEIHIYIFLFWWLRYNEWQEIDVAPHLSHRGRPGKAKAST